MEHYEYAAAQNWEHRQFSNIGSKGAAVPAPLVVLPNKFYPLENFTTIRMFMNSAEKNQVYFVPKYRAARKAGENDKRTSPYDMIYDISIYRVIKKKKKKRVKLCCQG